MDGICQNAIAEEPTRDLTEPYLKALRNRLEPASPLCTTIAAQAVRELCSQKRHGSALPGIRAQLHTWNGGLKFHSRVPMMITGGGVTQDGSTERARNSFPVRVKDLSRKIAALFRAAIHETHPELFAQVAARIWRQKWVSCSKPYRQDHDVVLKYLSRYVFRTALSNARILGMDESHVRFRFKNRKTGQWQIFRCPASSFSGCFSCMSCRADFTRCDIRDCGILPGGNSPRACGCFCSWDSFPRRGSG
jgi:hypothetical protein